MFGVMDLTTGRCWENYGEIELWYKKQFRGVDGNIAVPKEYINWWTSGHKCEKEGCFKDGLVKCHVPDYPPLLSKEPYDKTDIKVIEHLCPDHAYESGYCSLCGDFWGGIETFDIGNPSMLCEHCQEQIADENCEEDE